MTGEGDSSLVMSPGKGRKVVKKSVGCGVGIGVGVGMYVEEH